MSFLNYEPDILERVDILKKSQDIRRNGFDEIAQILVDRQKLEEFYARSLERLCESLGKIKIQGNQFLQQAILSVITLFSSQAEQSSTFAQSVSSDVLPSLRDIFKDDQITLKNMEKIGERHESDLIKNVNNFDKMRKKYMQINQSLDKKSKEQKTLESELLGLEKQYARVEDISIINQLKKRRQDVEMQQKVLDSIFKQKQNSEEELKQQISKYNSYINEYFLDVARVEDEIQKQEVEKRENLKDALMKYLVFKVSLIRNLQYDVDRITAKVSELDSKSAIKNYLTDLLALNKTNSSSPKPLLCKLNFDNYKCFIDKTYLPQASKDQILQQQKQQIQQYPQMIPQQQLPQQQQKPRTKIFSNSPLNQQQVTPPSLQKPTNFLPQQIQQQNNLFPSNQSSNQSLSNKLVEPQQNFQQYQKIQPFDPTKVQSSGEESEGEQQDIPQNDSKQVSYFPPSQESKIQEIQEGSGNRVVLMKNESKHLKQPNELKSINILELIKEKYNQNEDINSTNNPSGTTEKLVEIEREDFFEYLMLKMWHNNEIQGYDIDQLRQILEGDHTSRELFPKFFCQFFDEKRSLHLKQLIYEEKDIASRVLMSRGQKEVTIEINSDTYTAVMRILYCVLDVLNSKNDLNSIIDIFKSSKFIFKVIRPPDEDITAFERIFLFQGIQGHSLFSNNPNWQDKLKNNIEKLENEYRQKVIATGSWSEGIDEEKGGQQSNTVRENQFLYEGVCNYIRNLFEFEIVREKISKMVTNLIEMSVISSDLGSKILIFIKNFEKQDVTILQSEEISSQKAAIYNLQRKNEAENELNYDSFQQLSTQEYSNEQSNQASISSNQYDTHSKQEENNNNTDEDKNGDSDGSADIHQRYLEGLS